MKCLMDDDLPNYIMVMMANKKSKRQISDCLRLFLGGKTNRFIRWLFDIYDDLKENQKKTPKKLAQIKGEDDEKEGKEEEKQQNGEVANEEEAKEGNENDENSQEEDDEDDDYHDDDDEED